MVKKSTPLILHLHVHLKECFMDFGPVYSFWLFALERLNGILGSYHTNCHDISLQLMRQFTSHLHYVTPNWPDEYQDELRPLLQNHHCQQGSPQATTFEEMLQQPDLNNSIKPLPPVYEVAWEAHLKIDVHELVTKILGSTIFTLLTLHDKASYLSIRGYVLGSAVSRHVTKSLSWLVIQSTTMSFVVQE